MNRVAGFVSRLGAGNRAQLAVVLMCVTAHLDRYSCEEVFRRMDEYLDRELAPQEVERVRAHLETCVACASEYRFEDMLLREIRSKLRRVAMPADLRTRIERELGAMRPPNEGT